MRETVGGRRQGALGVLATATVLAVAIAACSGPTAVPDEPATAAEAAEADGGIPGEHQEDAVAAEPVLRVTLEVAGTAEPEPEQLEALVDDLERRGAELADDVEVRVEEDLLVVDLRRADDGAAEILATPAPQAALAIGRVLGPDAEPPSCGSADLDRGEACDPDESPLEVDRLTVLGTPTGVDVVTDPPSVSLTLASEDAAMLEDLTSDAACRRDQGPGGSGGSMLLLLDGVVVTRAELSPSIACDVGLTGGQLQVSFGPDPSGVGGTAEGRRALANDLLRIGAPSLRLVSVEEWRAPTS